MSRIIIILFFFAFIGKTVSQKSFRLIDDLRKYNLDSVNLKTLDFDETTIDLINWRLDFLREFNIYLESFERMKAIDKRVIKSDLGQFYYELNMGDYTFYKYNSKNIEVIKFYTNALELAQRNENIFLECEALKRILNLNRYLYLRDNVTTSSYLNRYRKIAYDEYEKAFVNYYDLIFSFQYFRNNLWDRNKSKELLNFANQSGYHYLNAIIYQLHGIYFHSISDNQKAIFFEGKALSEIEKIRYKYKSTIRKNSFYALTRYHVYNGSTEKASLYLDSIPLRAQNRIEAENQRFFYLYKSLIDSVNNDFLSAFKNLRIFNNENITYTIQKNQNAFSELESKYQSAKKEKQILEEQQKVRANRNWLIAAALALFLSSGIAILLQKNSIKKRQLAEQEAVLKQQRVDNLLKEQELVSIDAMITGQEKERQKVAGELHDDLGSLMATIKLHFDNAKVSKKDPALQNAQKLLEEAYQKIRGMAHSKNSGVMSDQGLLVAIKKMAKTITKTNALEVVVEDFGMGERMENSLELSIFRMVQELVANSIKHAEASKVNIQLTQHEDNLNIIVEDNGKGFDMSQVEKVGNGMGLTNIEKRVEHLEGSFTVDSIIGKGTSILIDIPV